MNFSLQGKVAVVTGGSKGIGLATAKEFLLEGADVAICARDTLALSEAEAQLQPYGNIFIQQADVRNQEEVIAFAKSVLEHYGRIDCWVNNVGATIVRKGDDYTASEVQMTVAVCFESAVYGCQAAHAAMAGHGGAIVNISSLAARCGTAGRSTLYGPLKAAVRELSVMFAAEYAADSIRVNAVLPGFTLTPAVKRNIPQEELDRNAAGTLLRRPALPQEIAKPIVFLCSEAASYITATSLEVSGGRAVVLNPEYAYQNHK